MILFINKLPRKSASLRIITEGNKTTICLEVGDKRYPMFWTVDESVQGAISKRFQTGVARLKDEVNRHDLFISDRLMALNRVVGAKLRPMKEGIEIISIPANPDMRTETEKKLPRNVIVVLSNTSDEIQVDINNPINTLEIDHFVEDDIVFDEMTIKWPSWRALKHRAALFIKTGDIVSGYELGSSANPKGQSQNDLIAMTDDDMAKFKSAEEAEKAKAEAIAKKKAAARAKTNPRSNTSGYRPTTLNSNRKPSNNRQGQTPGNRGNGNKPSYSNGNTHPTTMGNNNRYSSGGPAKTTTKR